MTKCSNGTNQSPIDINSNKIKTCSSTCNLSFYYRSSKCNLIMANKNVILENGILALHRKSFKPIATIYSKKI